MAFDEFMSPVPTQVQNICCARWEKYQSFLPHKSINLSWLLPQRVDPIKLVLGPFSFADRGQENCSVSHFPGSSEDSLYLQMFSEVHGQSPHNKPEVNPKSCVGDREGTARKYILDMDLSPHLQWCNSKEIILKDYCFKYEHSVYRPDKHGEKGEGGRVVCPESDGGKGNMLCIVPVICLHIFVREARLFLYHF